MSRSLAITSMMAMAGLSCALEAPSVAGLDAGLSSSGSGGDDTPTGAGGSLSGETGGASTTGSGGSGDPTGSGGSGGSGGGSGGSGGAMGMGGSSQGGSGGAPPMSDGGSDASAMSSDVAKALNGLRIDDTCSSPPATGATTCSHVMNPYHASKSVTIGGTTGTVYNVTVKIRGVVEPTIINGGTKPDMAGAPQFNLGGTPGDPTYQPWFLSISSPAATYYLNNYGFTNHTIHGINWQETIPMAAGAMVTLDVRDGNDHQICNTQAAQGVVTIMGVPGSMNGGQFIQIDVVSATPK